MIIYFFTLKRSIICQLVLFYKKIYIQILIWRFRNKINKYSKLLFFYYSKNFHKILYFLEIIFAIVNNFSNDIIHHISNINISSFVQYKIIQYSCYFHFKRFMKFISRFEWNKTIISELMHNMEFLY